MAPGVSSSQAYLVTRTFSPHGIQYTAAMTRGEVTQLDPHTDEQAIKAVYLEHTLLGWRYASIYGPAGRCCQYFLFLLPQPAN